MLPEKGLQANKIAISSNIGDVIERVLYIFVSGASTHAEQRPAAALLHT